MSQTIINSLVTDEGAFTVGACDIADFLGADSEKVTALFFTGDPDKKPETADVAVAIRELVRKNPEDLRLGVVARADEADLMKDHHVTTLPSVSFYKGAEHLETIARIQNWSVYEERLSALLVSVGRRPAA